MLFRKINGRYKVEHKVCGDMGVGDSVYRKIPGPLVGAYVKMIMKRDDFEWVRVTKDK